MDTDKVKIFIVDWLKQQLEQSGQKGFVVGVSGGIDSALTSALCGQTGYPLIVLNMPIYQEKSQFQRADEQIDWLKSKFNNVTSFTTDLSETFTSFTNVLQECAREELALVNSRARLRMLTLYAFANSHGYLVAGTGNKIEDFGIGFFTKYGDGGVDLSPIADLKKSEVFELAGSFGIPDSILTAPPTDGLWANDRTDEQQIGASYDELEWAMDYCEGLDLSLRTVGKLKDISERQKEVLHIYLKRHYVNMHKMKMPPICDLKTVF